MAVRITELFSRVSSRSALPVALVSALTGVAVAAAGSAAPTGRIIGTVRIVAPPRTPVLSGAYPARRVSPQAPPASEVTNVVVFVKDAPASTTVFPMHAQIVQQAEAFVPRVVAITRGSTVDFPNSDPFFHNVFSLSRGAAFDLGRFRRGESRSRVFSQAGLVKVFCHIHSHMSASIMIFDHRHFTMPAIDGTFSLDDVAPGTYRLSAWHDRIGEAVRTLNVEAGRMEYVEFALPMEGR